MLALGKCFQSAWPSVSCMSTLITGYRDALTWFLGLETPSGWRWPRKVHRWWWFRLGSKSDVRPRWDDGTCLPLGQHFSSQQVRLHMESRTRGFGAPVLRRENASCAQVVGWTLFLLQVDMSKWNMPLAGLQRKPKNVEKSLQRGLHRQVQFMGLQDTGQHPYVDKTKTSLWASPSPGSFLLSHDNVEMEHAWPEFPFQSKRSSVCLSSIFFFSNLCRVWVILRRYLSGMKDIRCIS